MRLEGEVHLQRLLCDEVIPDQTQMPASWPSPHPEASGSRPSCRPSSSHIWAVIKPLTVPAVATCSLTSVLQAAGVSVATGGFLEERDGWSLQPFCTASPPSTHLLLYLFICSNRLLLQPDILPTNHCCAHLWDLGHGSSESGFQEQRFRGRGRREMTRGPENNQRRAAKQAWSVGGRCSWIREIEGGGGGGS